MQTSSPRGATVGRLAGLAVLLLAELLILGFAFDGQALSRRADWYGAWLANAKILPQLLLATAGATLILFPRRTREAVARLTAAYAARPYKAVSLAAHLLSFAATYHLSESVFNGPSSALTAAAWAAAAAITLLSWLNCLAPFAFWAGEAVRQRTPALVGAAVGAAAWLAGLAAGRLWEPLGTSTFRLTSAGLQLLYPHVSAEPKSRVISVGDFAVEIADECSGLEGVGLFLVFWAAYLWFFRDRQRFPASLLLFPVGAGVMWLANAVRIGALVVIGAEISPAIASQGFHSQAGWIAFIAVALSVVWLAGRVSFFRAAGAPARAGAPSETPAYLVPVLTLLCTAMATGALSAGIDWMYPVRVFTGAAALWFFRDSYRRFAVKPSWESIGVGAAVFLLWYALEPTDDGGGSALHAGLAEMGKRTASVWICFRLAGSVLLVPIAEELAFRGYLIRRLTSRDFETLALTPVAVFPALVSSVGFGLLHGRWLAGTIAGLAYAFSLHRRGELSDPIAAHMTTNALIAVAVLGAGAWRLWL